MQIFLRGLGMCPCLSDWEGRPPSPGVLDGPRPGDSRDCYEREIGRERPGAPEEAGPLRRVAAAIWRYDIFPPVVVSGVLRRSPVQPGDTVGICYHGPLGVDLFFAAQVIDCFDGTPRDRPGSWRTGFTYRTLTGHPELGEETFAVEKDCTSGAVRVVLRSWSRPGIWLARLGAPLVRRLQVRASHAALAHLARRAKADS